DHDYWYNLFGPEFSRKERRKENRTRGIGATLWELVLHEQRKRARSKAGEIGSVLSGSQPRRSLATKAQAGSLPFLAGGSMKRALSTSVRPRRQIRLSQIAASMRVVPGSWNFEPLVDGAAPRLPR